MELDVVLRLNISSLILIEIFVVKGITAVLLTVHSAVYELIWFKLAVMIDTVKVNILILV